MGAEEGGVVGDEEYNPLAQYDDLAAVKEEQMAKKQVKKISARQAQYVCIYPTRCVEWLADTENTECRQ